MTVAGNDEGILTKSFQGLRVLDFSTTIAGPHCTRMLADMGAEVIKIESAEGETMRTRPPVRNSFSTVFGQLNLGKKSVVFDLKSPDAIPAFMRVARAATLTLARREFVIAAQALGATHARILLRELLPNVILPLFAFFLLGVAVTIVVEGALSFLGLGVPPPISSWGSMIGEGRESLEIAPQLAFIPAIAMFLTVLSFNLVGDTLRALTDPRQGAL